MVIVKSTTTVATTAATAWRQDTVDRVTRTSTRTRTTDAHSSSSACLGRNSRTCSDFFPRSTRPGSVVLRAMDIVVNTPHGDADVSIVAHGPDATLADLLVMVTGQAVPLLADVDGHPVRCSTVLDRSGPRHGQRRHDRTRATRTRHGERDRTRPAHGQRFRPQRPTRSGALPNRSRTSTLGR